MKDSSKTSPKEDLSNRDPLRVHFYRPTDRLSSVFAWVVRSPYSHVAFEHNGAVYELNYRTNLTGWYAAHVLHEARPPALTIEVMGTVDQELLESAFRDSIPKAKTAWWYLKWWLGSRTKDRPYTCLNKAADLLKRCQVDVGAPVTPQDLQEGLLQAGGRITHGLLRPARTDPVPQDKASQSFLLTFFGVEPYR